MNLIEVRDIHKSFKMPRVRRDTFRDHFLHWGGSREAEQLRVLNGIDLAVARGEALGIMGANGCGKSTLLKIICGIYRPDRGRVELRGAMTSILELGIGWNMELNAIDNILLMCTIRGMSLRWAKAAVAEILAFAELERFSEMQMKFYSSGMSARLAYAVAFHSVREILIIDEVFAVGDASFKNKCLARFRQLAAAGHTLVFVTHAPFLIEQFCTKAVFLNAGRIELAGTPAEVSAAYLNQQRAGDDAPPQL